MFQIITYGTKERKIQVREKKHKSYKEDKKLLESFATFCAETSTMFIFKAGYDIFPEALLCFN